MKEMKNENVHMQALHHKLDVVLVQILHYNCSQADYSFCEDLSPSRTPPATRTRVSPSDPFSPPLFFSLRRPWYDEKFAISVQNVVYLHTRTLSVVLHSLMAALITFHCNQQSAASAHWRNKGYFCSS